MEDVFQYMYRRKVCDVAYDLLYDGGQEDEPREWGCACLEYEYGMEVLKFKLSERGYHSLDEFLSMDDYSDDYICSTLFEVESVKGRMDTIASQYATDMNLRLDGEQEAELWEDFTLEYGPVTMEERAKIWFRVDSA
jgi:hypothetical protein